MKFTNNDIKAFAVLGISVGLKWDKIQQKFKKLVKKFHPDINAGDKNYEEKSFKVITLAYTQLKNTYRKKLENNLNIKPDIKLSVKQTFGIDS